MKISDPDGYKKILQMYVYKVRDGHYIGTVRIEGEKGIFGVRHLDPDKVMSKITERAWEYIDGERER